MADYGGDVTKDRSVLSRRIKVVKNSDVNNWAFFCRLSNKMFAVRNRCEALRKSRNVQERKRSGRLKG